MKARFWRWLVLLVLLAIWHELVKAQDMGRVRSVVDTLCSPEMHGRGYVLEGEKKAADYLAGVYEGIGLEKLGKSYLQKFQFDVNTFPKQVALQVGKKILMPGKDFIPDANSGHGWGEGKWEYLDTLVFSDANAQEKFIKSNLENTVLVYDHKFEKDIFNLPPDVVRKFLAVNAVIVLHDKLTFAVGKNQLKFPKFHVLREAFPEKGKKIIFQLDAVMKYGHTSQNVLGIVSGTSEPDSFLVVTAHYDHLGGIGELVYIPGGNDNASGVAMMLELAHYFAENPLPYSLLFIAFGAEEAGLLGSEFYTKHPVVPLEQMKFLINLDMFATGEDGMMVVNGLVFDREFQKLAALNEDGGYLHEIKKRGKAANSDHYYFSEAGVPAFFFYLMGDWQNYHDVFDAPPLPLTKFEGAYQLIKGFLVGISGMTDVGG